jgi:hypothetical protein
MEQLLASDKAAMLERVAESEHAVHLFRAIQETQTDSAIRWRIEGIVRTIEFKQRTPKRDFFSGGLRP